MAKLEACGLPYAHIARPEDLFDDPHLTASGALLPVTLPDGSSASLPTTPIEMNGRKPGLSRDLPASGEHTAEVLGEIGYDAAALAELEAEDVISCGKGGIKDMPRTG